MTYEAELRRLNAPLRLAAAVQPHEHALDIGCGSGQTTREAARTARSALGIDISKAAVERARELARAEGLGNITFDTADAQTHSLPPERFDLAISRFGTMFFDDPVAAFANIRTALRPAGRLVMMVWRSPEHNEWEVCIRQALAVTTAPGGPDAFSLADPATVGEILTTAGFADVTVTDVHEPVYYGPDVATALGWVRGFTSTSEALKHLDPTAAAGALDRLREMLAAHLTDDGVRFDSRAWIVSAHRP